MRPDERHRRGTSSSASAGPLLGSCRYCFRKFPEAVEPTVRSGQKFVKSPYGCPRPRRAGCAGPRGRRLRRRRGRRWSTSAPGRSPLRPSPRRPGSRSRPCPACSTGAPTSPRARASGSSGCCRSPATAGAASRRAQAGLIDLVFNDLDSPWAIEVMRGVEDAAHAAGVGTVLSALHRQAGVDPALALEPAGPGEQRRGARHHRPRPAAARGAAQPARARGRHRPGRRARPRRADHRRQQLRPAA